MLAAGTLLTAMLLAGGCGRYRSPAIDATAKGALSTPASQGRDAEHLHRGGSMGGVLTSLGRDEYHAEAVMQDDGTFALYLFGADETRLHEVPHQVLTAYLRPAGGGGSAAIILKADPLPGDAQERTSRFTGLTPEPFRNRALSIMVPGLRIDGERFAARFELLHAPDLAMPEAVDDEQARELYLTAGGLYSNEDIEANGRTTAAAKYQGFQAQHDANPPPGAAVCPITQTKANLNCNWIIGGETYFFCCPPCIDEFVALAKTSPEMILAPGDYIQPHRDSHSQAAPAGETEVGGK